MRMIITQAEWDTINAIAIASPVFHAQLDAIPLSSWQKSSLDYGGRPQLVTHPHQQYWLAQRLWLAAQRVQVHVSVDLSTGIQVSVAAPIEIQDDVIDCAWTDGEQVLDEAIDLGCVEYESCF